MPSIEDGLWKTLSTTTSITTLLGGDASRVMAGLAPQSKEELPRLMYSVLGQERVYTASGARGACETSVQIAAWAATPKEARAIATAVRVAFSGGVARPVLGVGTTDAIETGRMELTNSVDVVFPIPENEELRAFGRIQDWQIYHAESLT